MVAGGVYELVRASRGGSVGGRDERETRQPSGGMASNCQNTSGRVHGSSDENVSQRSVWGQGRVKFGRFELP